MKIITLFLALSLVGCASGPTGRLPPVNINQPAGEIFVIRDNSILAFANSFYIAVDGVDVFAIRKGQHTKFKLRAGKHFFGMKHLGGGYRWIEDYKEINVLPGSETYIVVSPNMNSIAIQIVDKKEGMERMN